MCKFGYKYDEYEPEQQAIMNEYYSQLFERKPNEFVFEKKKKSRYRKVNEKILNRCVIKHEDKYDYCSWNLNLESRIIHVGCPIHDVFKIDKYVHAKGQGCQKCSAETLRKRAFDSFLVKATAIYGNRFIYSEDTFIKSTLPMTAFCSEHGYFSIIPNSHTHNKVHCPACKNRKPQKPKEIKKSKDIQ
jgi:hypothetical protein